MPAHGSGRALFRRMASLYLQASLAAAIVTLLLVLLGLGFTGRQWAILLSAAVPGILTYTLTDVILIRHHLKPIRAALDALDAEGSADGDVLGRAMTRALNLPFLSFLRVTCLHGPLATILLCSVLIGANQWLMTDYETWQIVAFACTVMFFASPTHAIFEYFSVSENMEPTIKRLSRALGSPTLPPEHQTRLIAIRLKEKLLYLAIFVASLPLMFFAFSMVFKIEQLFRQRGLSVEFAEMLPLYSWIGGVVVVCVLGAFAMALLTAREVSRSAGRMLAAMERVESGRLDEAHLDVISTDEYADLFRGFGLMVDSLRQEQQILAVSHDLAGELQLDVLIARIMHAAADLLGAERSTLFVHDAKTDELVSIYAAGIETREIRIPSHKGIAGAVFTTGRVENIADPYADPRFDQEVDLATGFRTRNILCAPISNKAGGRIGVTQVLNKHGGGFTAKDEARLRAFSAQVAVSLENAKLFDDVLNMKNYNDSILKSISNAVITLDEDDRIVTVNDAAEGLLGHRRQALLGTAIDSAFRDNRWLIDSLRQTVATGEATLAVDAQLARDGMPPATVNFTATPLMDGADHRLGSIAVIEDITQERRVRATMARYMSQEVADQLLAAGEAELSGKVQEVSILFSDVRGFTTIAETLGARETVSLLNEYFSEMVDVIFDNGGILDKYIGDAIMALFGAPFQSAEDADHALTVANQMMQRLSALNRRLREAGRLELQIGVGLSTGDVVVGNIGSSRRMEYTVIGDSVNLASRLEGANKQYGTRILLSEFTCGRLKRPALLREVDLVRVKGKDQPVAVFESLGYRETEPGGAALAKMLDYYQRGLEAYRGRAWRDAATLFSGALAAMPDDGPSALYLQRARRYGAKPPPDSWDGVWTMTEK